MNVCYNKCNKSRKEVIKMTNREKLIIFKTEMLNTMIAIADEDYDDEARDEFMRAVGNNVNAVTTDADDFYFAFTKFWELYE